MCMWYVVFRSTLFVAVCVKFWAHYFNRTIVVELVTVYVIGALLAKGPDSSFGEVHRGSCSEPIHMEDEVKRSGGRDK